MGAGFQSRMTAVALAASALMATPVVVQAQEVTPPPPPPVSAPPEPHAPGVRLEYIRPPVVIPAPPKPRPEDFTNVTWSVRPVVEYPERALQRGVSYGQVVIECRVGAGGAPQDCSVVMENPVGLGFGGAVLAAMEPARVSPDIPQGAAFRFPVNFRLAAPEPLAPPETAPKPTAR